MPHAHNHSHHGHHHHHGSSDGQSLKRLKFALVLNLSFSAIELVGGLWTGSVAILADAVHDFGDAIALGMAVYLEAHSGQGPTVNYSYGLKRLSLLSAVLTGVVLVTGSVVIAVEAIQRLFEGGSAPFGWGMIGFAVLGLVVNSVAALRLMKGRTHNEKIMTWHMIEDVLGWAAVLIGALFIQFFGWVWLDPALAIAISLFVGYNAIKNLVQVTLVFLQRMPHGFDSSILKNELLGIAGVKGIHDLHVWSLDGEQHVVSLHAVLDQSVDVAKIKKEVRHLAGHHGSVHTTIEIESMVEACAENCDPKVK